MRNPKKQRHSNDPKARSRAAENRAHAEREDGIPDRPPRADERLPIEFDLTSWGGPRVLIEARFGYISGRRIDQATGQVLQCAALKTLLHDIADKLPRTLGQRNQR